MTTLSVIIPTYNRGEVLLKTLTQLGDQKIKADSVIVVDQTDYGNDDLTAASLQALHEADEIVWLRRQEPSIPKAMNAGLKHANSDRVLFLDDDVEFDNEFISKHLDTIAGNASLAHVGQIVQPWQASNQTQKHSRSAQGLYADLSFSFNSSLAASIRNCMAGNLCVDRQAAIEAGGFDEQFFGVAYRFETEFCKRFCEYHDCEFLYSPEPLLHHLHIKKGGTRAHADFLTSAKPAHSMGDYYYALVRGRGWPRIRYICARFFKALAAKFYLRKPWYLPVRAVAEIRGLTAAFVALSQGPKLIQQRKREASN